MMTNKKAGILDSTLREGEQTPGVVFTTDQRIDIATRLSDTGVSMIEAGHPAVAPDVYEGIKGIVKLKKDGVIKPVIIAHSRAVKSDVETAASLDVDRIAIFYGVSDRHLAAKTHKTREQALSIIGEAISFAKSQGVPVRFTPEDATRTDYDYLVSVIKTARDAGADRIGIADTVGIMWPLETRNLFQRLIHDVPGVEFDIHAHNDMGNAVANSLAAVDGGATIVHATVNGLGERVGITPTQVIAVALKYHLGLDVAKLDKLVELSALVEKYSGLSVSANFPITGDYAFVHKSGVHVAGILSNPETYEFMDPSLLNKGRNYVIDKYTGKHALKSRLDGMGILLNDEQLSDLLNRIKNNQSAKFFRDEELLEIAEEVTGKMLKPRPPEYIEGLVWVKCGSNVYTTSVTRRISIVNNVTEVMEVSGDYDIMVRIKARDPAQLNQVIEDIRSVKGVGSTLSSLVLKKM